MYFSLLIPSPLGDLVAIANETHLLTLMFADSSGFEKIIEKFGFVIPSKVEGVSIPLVGGSLSKSFYEKKDFLYSGVKEKGIPLEGQKGNYILLQTQKELSQYFSGSRKTFTIPLAQEGTDFQKKAWQALTKIPYGETRSYKEEALLAGNPKAVRAIGGANNRNPIVIIIPCHRVIGADGKLVGYGGGMERKIWLLAHEKMNRR